MHSQTGSKRSLTPHEANRLLDKLYLKFGKVVFLVLDYGTKKFKNRDWEKITYEQTLKPAYRACLVHALVRGGNIAVRLGPLSDRLRAIDIDLKDRVEEFGKLNPGLDLKVLGLKGAQYFCRLSANFVHQNNAVDKLKTAAGQEFGEWRHGESGGAYSMIYGQHPDDPGVVFQLEGESVPCLDFAALSWPKDIVLPWSTTPARAYVAGDPTPQTGSADLDARIRAYIDTVDVAIEGEGGSAPTYRLACALVHRWGLGRDEAIQWMHYYSERRCKPPWSDKEIEHKIDDALKATDHQHPYGDLRDVCCDIPPEGFEGENSSNPSNPSGGISQQTPFPEDSILSDYYEYAITQSQGADAYMRLRTKTGGK